MYLDFYGFTKCPFQTTPDPGFLFLSNSHKEALASMIYGIRQRKGFVAITGEVGVGKTLVLRSYMETVDKQTQKTIYIFNPKVSIESLLTAILREFEVQPAGTTASEMLTQLHELLITEYRAGRSVVLVIDEAQNIPAETLEGIRMLSNLETSTEKLIQMVLVGQPELEALLDRHELRQVRERIAVRAKITPLSKKESVAYVTHRLAQASTEKRVLFSAGALRLIATAAQGIPRRLNILCDNALITGFGYNQATISRKIAKEVIRDLQGQGTPRLWRRALAYLTIGLIALIVPPFLYTFTGASVPWGTASVAFWHTNGPSVNHSVSSAQAGATIAPDHRIITAQMLPSLPAQQIAAAPFRVNATLTTEKMELSETARLLAVLLDSGRVVVGRAQAAINNPRLEHKGFSSSVFESQLRQEFMTRTGHDLRDLAPAPMPERAKPLLVRLAFFMQKAVQEAQTDINKKGIGFKGFIPATFGTQVAARFSKDTGVRLRQIGPPGIDPRNPENKPDDAEEQAMLAVQKSHPRVGDHVVEQPISDNGVRVLLPLFYKKQCLACHGKPKGELDISGYEREGFKEGDLGGAISIVLHGESAKGEAKAEGKLEEIVETKTVEKSEVKREGQAGVQGKGTAETTGIAAVRHNE